MFFPSGSLSLNFAPKVLKHFFRSVSRSPWRITLSLHPTEIPLSWILLHSDKHFASTVVFAQFVFATACLRPANVFLSTVTVRFQQPDLHSGSRAKSALLEFPSGSLSLNFAPKVLKHFFRSVSRSPWRITLSLHPTEFSQKKAAFKDGY